MDNPEKESSQKVVEDTDFRSILELQQDGIVILDEGYSVQYLNQPAAQMLNLSWSDSLGSSFPFAVAANVRQDLSISSDPERWVRLSTSETIWKGRKSYLVQVREITDHKREENRLSVAASAAETRAMELEALKFVADQLNQIVLRDDTIQAGLQTVLALYPSEMVWVLLPAEHDSYQMYAAYSTPSPVLSEKRMLKGDIQCMWIEKVLKGELAEPCMLNLKDCMAQIGFSTSIPVVNYSIPLYVNGKPMGLLNLVPSSEKELDFEEFKTLKTIGQQFTFAIQRALPPMLAVSRTNYYAAADLTDRMTGSELDLVAVTKNVLKLAVEITGAEAGTLGLVNANRMNLTFQAMLPETLPQQVFTRSDDLLWDVIDNGTTALLTGEALAEKLPMFFTASAKSVILVPVSLGSKVLGVLALYSLQEERPLNDFNRAIAESLGKQAGMAVQNAHQFLEVQQLTVTDPLTGLHNQKSFITQAVREMERAWRYKRPLSILSVVIDDIRSLNDQYGREIGDRIMQILGQICTESLRKVDVIGRYTGSNFIILLPETDEVGARDVAERLRMKAEGWRLGTSEGTVHFTISLGIAGLVNNEVLDLERFIDRANQALYTALQAGGNRALVWAPEKKKR